MNNVNVQGYNRNNLVTKNPFPGNNVNFHVEPQVSDLNVSGYDNSEYEQLTVNNNANNTIPRHATIAPLENEKRKATPTIKSKK